MNFSITRLLSDFEKHTSVLHRNKGGEITATNQIIIVKCYTLPLNPSFIFKLFRLNLTHT